jgi:hypothetical protein
MVTTDGVRAYVKVRGKNEYRLRIASEIAALRRRDQGSWDVRSSD